MEIFIKIYVFIIGMIFGSFFNVCIFRIPEKQSVSNPPSHCPNCNTRLKPKDLVPVLSYLVSGRKCRYCKKEISSRYALVELLTGILFLLVYNRYLIDIATINYLVLISLLIIITFIDIDHYIIPDELVIIGSIFAIIFNLIFKVITIKESLLGALVCGGGILILVYIIEFIVKKEVMGGGDIKLFAMIGLFFGVKNSLLVALLSVYVGAAFGIITIVYSKIKKQEYNSMIPYGPFISVATLIVMLYGNEIVNWYLNFI
ncbi:MAG: prepilin peptidase [Clostridium sp.]|nr:prepilin peptidase [Clostridium sp.]MCI7206865.1 prepilin peptidase [Clostridium sp.]